MEIVAEYLTLAQEGNEVVLHYENDEVLGRNYAFKDESEAEKFCGICRSLASFIDESEETANSSRKASAHRTLLAEIVKEQDLQVAVY